MVHGHRKDNLVAFGDSTKKLLLPRDSLISYHFFRADPQKLILTMRCIPWYAVIYSQAKCWSAGYLFNFLLFLFWFLLFLRQPNHSSIIKYFGTNLLYEQYGTKVMIVLELCNCSLKSQSKPENSYHNLTSSVIYY